MNKKKEKKEKKPVPKPKKKKKVKKIEPSPDLVDRKTESVYSPVHPNSTIHRMEESVNS